MQIERLKEIKNIYEQYDKAERNIKLHEYLALKAKEEITEEEIKKIKSYINKYDEKIRDLDREINLAENEVRSYTEKINKYNLELEGNKEFKLIIGTNTYNTFKEASAYIKGDATSGYYVDLTSVSKTATVEVSYWEIFTGTNS